MSLPRIKFHLVVEASTGHAKSACGLLAIPMGAQRTFAAEGSHFVGTVRGSVGRAFNGLSEVAWHHDNAPTGMCGACHAKWQGDPEIRTDVVLNPIRVAG